MRDLTREKEGPPSLTVEKRERRKGPSTRYLFNKSPSPYSKEKKGPHKPTSLTYVDIPFFIFLFLFGFLD